MHKSLLALIMLTSTACSSDSDEDKVQLRVVHASPDAPAVDVYAAGDATPLFRDVAYGEATAYAELAAGSYTIELRAAGSPASSAPAFTTPVTLGEGQVTALAAGFFASTDADSRFRIVPLVEGWGADTSGTARLRIVHAAADAPTVALDVGDDGSAEIAALARFADTGAAGVELPSGQALQVGVRAGGERVTAFTTPALAEGSDLFVIATGRLGARAREADGFGLLVVSPSQVVGLVKQNPVVHALHASPDAPAVDVFAGAGELSDELAFSGLSAPIQVPPGSYTLDLFAHAAGSARPAGAPAFTYVTPSLAAGERYLVVATGFLTPVGGEEPFRIEAYVERFSEDAGALVRVVHGSPDAPAVDVGAIGTGGFAAVPSLSELGFAAASADAGAALPAGPLSVGVAAAGTTTPVARFELTMPAGRALFAVAAGALTPAADEEGFRLVIVDTTASPWTAVTVLPE